MRSLRFGLGVHGLLRIVEDEDVTAETRYRGSHRRRLPESPLCGVNLRLGGTRDGNLRKGAPVPV
jgi:hypothetical protein